MTETEVPEEKPRHRWADKLEERRIHYQRRGRVYRVGFVFVGALVTLAGCLMLVTPGPAFVVIPIGLAMLAMEFAWAEYMLEKALIQADKAAAAAAEASTREKIFGAIATALVIAAIVGAIFYWDINLPIINPD